MAHKCLSLICEVSYHSSLIKDNAISARAAKTVEIIYERVSNARLLNPLIPLSLLSVTLVSLLSVTLDLYSNYQILRIFSDTSRNPQCCIVNFRSPQTLGMIKIRASYPSIRGIPGEITNAYILSKLSESDAFSHTHFSVRNPDAWIPKTELVRIKMRKKKAQLPEFQALLARWPVTYTHFTDYMH